MNNEKNSEISERILQMIEFVKVSPNKFSKKLGYDRTQTIYDILNCKSAPSFDFFQRLFNSEYSEFFNPIWLLTGKGQMLLTGAEPTGIPSSPTACQACAVKERDITRLNNIIDRQERLIASLEKASAAQAPPYSQTA